MQLDQLTETELLALVGLLKLIVRADGRLSDAELASLQAFAQEAGEASWMQALDEADRSLRTRDEVLAQAREVKRPEARGEILARLRTVADADGIAAPEAEVLGRIEALWSE